jgi:hypothetical protein
VGCLKKYGSLTFLRFSSHMITPKDDESNLTYDLYAWQYIFSYTNISKTVRLSREKS